jgi:hypothetical protein
LRHLSDHAKIKDESGETSWEMRYLITLLPLLCASGLLLGACADYNATHGLSCSPAYSPGTPAYKACLIRNGEGTYED